MRLAVLVCFLALAATALGQLNYDKSYFLYTPTHGTLTLTSMYLPSLRTYNFTMPPYSPDIGIQSLTDISNSRFIVWSGNDLGAQGVNYTFYNLSYTSNTLTPLNSFLLPPEIGFIDMTYDLTIQKPVSLIRNSTDVSCWLLIGYGPVSGQPLDLTRIAQCGGVNTIGSWLLGTSGQSWVMTVANGPTWSNICLTTVLSGNSSNCFNKSIVISNVAGASRDQSQFWSVFTQDGVTRVGTISALGFPTTYALLSAGDVPYNYHLPVYYDPYFSIFAGAWTTTSNQAELFATTSYPTSWNTTVPLPEASSYVVGVSLAYSPAPAPKPTPPGPAPVSPPSMQHLTGPIVGAVLGFVALIAFGLGVFYFLRRRKSFQYRSLPDNPQ